MRFLGGSLDVSKNLKLKMIMEPFKFVRKASQMNEISIIENLLWRLLKDDCFK